LPAPYNQGVLIDENGGSGGYLQFGPDTHTHLATLSGVPSTSLDVRVNGGPLQAVPSELDSGGVEGSLPANLGVQPGDNVAVYAPNGTLLYDFVDQGTYFPTTVSSGQPMNTGAIPFFDNPIYISYSPHGIGTAFIDS
jgi:hypothetical protein